MINHILTILIIINKVLAVNGYILYQFYFHKGLIAAFVENENERFLISRGDFHLEKES